MKRFELGFAEKVVTFRWLIIIATLLTVMGAGSGARFLTFVNDTRVFFSEENPQLKALEALENTYTKSDNVFFIVAPDDGNVFTKKTLAAVEELTEAAWQIPYSSRVDSITNFQHTRAEDDDLIVEDLVLGAENLTDADLERIREIAISEPLLVNWMVSPSGAVTGLNVTVLKPGESIDEVPKITAFARNLKDEMKRKYPSIDFYIAGGVMLDNAFGEASEQDMGTLVPGMFVVLLIITGVALRSAGAVFGTLLIIVFSTLTALGLAGWMGYALNPASMTAPTIILTLAVADSIHLLVAMLHQMHNGKTKHEAVVESVRVNLQPVFITSATTAVGFLSMNFSDVPPFRDLGNIVAMGVMIAFVYSVTFLPALMSIIPLKVRALSGTKAGAGSCCSMNTLACFIIRRRREVFWGTILVIVVLTAGTTRIELNDNWIKYFDKSFDARRAFDFMQENLTGFDLIEYSLESGEEGGINNPEYLAKVEEFVSWYRAQNKVVHVSAITDTMKRLNKNMHGDDESYYRLPESRELAAQYLLLYEMSLPFGLDLNNTINVDKSATRMIVTLEDTTTREQREIDTRAREWLKANAPETMFTYGSGLTVIFAHISERNINSMLGAAFWALILISGILIVALKSVKLGVVSLIPNLAPAFMAFGVWGFFVSRVGLGLSVVVSLTLGIVVDDTVHFISKYLRARREHGMDPEDAVLYTFNNVGKALWVTSLALVAGFMILTFSGYKMNSEMGLLTAITITIALGLDFFFLPVLLIKVEEKHVKKQKAGTIEDMPALGEEG